MVALTKLQIHVRTVVAVIVCRVIPTNAVSAYHHKIVGE